jgi:flagellin
MIVSHNMQAMNANRWIGINDNMLTKAMERLSSGYQINRAADDAAAMTISERMRGQIRGLSRGSLNVEEGLSLIQVADGALNEVQSITQRIRELAVQASNDVNCDEDRKAIDKEVQRLKEEVDRIFSDTEYNTKNIFYAPELILDGTAAIQSGSTLPPGAVIEQPSASAERMKNTYTDPNTGTKYHAAVRINFAGVNMGNLGSLANTGFFQTCCTCDAHYCIELDPNSNTNTQAGNRHKTYTVGVAGCSTAADLVNAIVNAVGGRPNNHFTNYAVDPGDPTGQTLLMYDNRPSQTAQGSRGIIKPGVTVENPKAPEKSLWIQAGSNTNEVIKLTWHGMNTNYIGLAGASTTTFASSQLTISEADQALEFVSRERSSWGAYQNRLEHAKVNNDNSAENTQYAESMLRDADMANEAVQFAKNKILAQSGNAMLTSANHSRDDILGLLK